MNDYLEMHWYEPDKDHRFWKGKADMNPPDMAIHRTVFYNETDSTFQLEGELWGKPKSLMFGPHKALDLGPCFWNEMRITRIAPPEPERREVHLLNHLSRPWQLAIAWTMGLLTGAGTILAYRAGKRRHMV